ncbi:DUF4422 domain-containing protein [Sunxiuqinia sp. sy24]|uniref:DUF4422 domain-containing protein n=1 Tax=Sunxiuqinia sp. sy24 TaxID=3461495 RepID=UPI004045279D
MKKTPKVELYTFFYKKAPVIIDQALYIPVMAGNALSNAALEMQGDDTGDHISSKNSYYSELTGTYWVWKNTIQDIVGVVHYRRFLTQQAEPLPYRFKRMLYYLVGIHYKRYGLIYTKDVRKFKHAVLSENEIIDLLNEYDVILPTKRKLKYTVRKHYQRYHNEKDLELLQSIIQEKYSDYSIAFEQMLASKRMYANNMFVMKRPDFDRLMAWLFDLLFEFESRIQLAEYQEYQERVIGFIAERLLNVWFEKEQPRIKELPVIYFKHFKFTN